MRKQSLPPSFSSRSVHHEIIQWKYCHFFLWIRSQTRERKLTLPVMNLCQQHPNHQYLQHNKHQGTSSVIPLYRVHSRNLTPQQSSQQNMNCVQCMTLSQVNIKPLYSIQTVFFWYLDYVLLIRRLFSGLPHCLPAIIFASPFGCLGNRKCSGKSTKH